MRWSILTLLTACYTPAPPAGVPCDPSAPVCPTDQACIAAEMGFACLPIGTPPLDGPTPDQPPPPACSNNPRLAVCFSFDAPMLSSPLPNEGRLAVSAEIVDVTRIEHDIGGAAQLRDTSTMLIPANTEVVGIVASEVAIRLDVLVPAMMRVGVTDSDTADPGMSMFVFGGDPHQLRCNIGGTDLFVDLAVTVGTWIEVACICNQGVLTAQVDGVKLGEIAGCSPAAATMDGLQIGQNNRGGTALPPNEPLIGAIDDVRLWTDMP